MWLFSANGERNAANLISVGAGKYFSGVGKYGVRKYLFSAQRSVLVVSERSEYMKRSEVCSRCE